MKTQFLFLVFISLALTNPPPFVGGFNNLSNDSDQDYSNVLNFTLSKIQTLTDWNLTSIKRQVVNGFNYVITFGRSTDKAEVRVYSTFGGTMQITSFNVNGKAQRIPEAKPQKIASPSLPTLNEVNNTNSTNANRNITNTTNTNANTSNSGNSSNANTSKLGAQSANQTNQNSTVQNIYQILHPSNTTTANISRITLGGYRALPLDNATTYSTAWNQVLLKYPNLTNFKIIEVGTQVVAGINFLFIIQSPTQDQMIVIRVFHSLNKSYTVSILQSNTAKGFTANQIINLQKQCIRLRPQLSEYDLVLISLLGREGVQLVFRLDPSVITANCRQANGSFNIQFV